MVRRAPRKAKTGRTRNLRLARSFFERNDSGGPSGSPVVVGLGNPGRSYERTRHNAGYLVVEELARRHGGSWRRKKKSQVADVSLGPKNVTLLKPTTFMNNSGSALAGLRAETLILVHDDLDLDPGTVRVKVGGGAGGHNGLRSAIQNVGPDFVRVRIGVGRPPEGARMTVTDFVLGRMDAAVKDALPRAADVVEAILDEGTEGAMNRFNARNTA
jgi:peptidyl-tRNA hydrolase, PTH1 family